MPFDLKSLAYLERPTVESQSTTCCSDHLLTCTVGDDFGLCEAILAIVVTARCDDDCWWWKEECRDMLSLVDPIQDDNSRVLGCILSLHNEGEVVIRSSTVANVDLDMVLPVKR